MDTTTTPETTTVTMTLHGDEYDVRETPVTGAPVAYAPAPGMEHDPVYFAAVKTAACPTCLAGSDRDCQTPAGPDALRPHPPRHPSGPRDPDGAVVSGTAMTTAAVRVGGQYAALNGVLVTVESVNRNARTGRTTFTVAGQYDDGSKYVAELPASSLFEAVRS